MSSVDESAFAHPVERELARVFDSHGIAWRYEPHTFRPRARRRRNRAPGVHSRLYLPDLDVYIVCTVARQPLTGRKRQKARKVREWNGVTVEILSRRDIERLALRWHLWRLERAARQPA